MAAKSGKRARSFENDMKEAPAGARFSRRARAACDPVATPRPNAGSNEPHERRQPNHRPRRKPRRADLDFNNGDRLIDIRALKVAVRMLPVGSAVRMLIMEEPDTLLLSEYAVKVGVWFRLMKDGEAK